MRPFIGLLLAAFAMAGLTGCDLAVAFNADISALRVIEGDPESEEAEVEDVLTLPEEIEDFNINDLKEMKERGYTVQDIKSLTLQEVTFTLREGAPNFDFVDKVRVEVGANGMEPMVLVPETTIEKGVNQVTLIAEPVELKKFARAKGAYLKAYSVGRLPEQDIKVHAKVLFRVEITAGL